MDEWTESKQRKRQKLSHPAERQVTSAGKRIKCTRLELHLKTLHGLFEHSYRLHPTRTAVEYVEYDANSQQVTSTAQSYAQLMSQVRNFTAVLTHQYKVQRGDVIGVLGPATPDTIAALLAVLFTSAAVAPLELHNSRAPDLSLTLVIGTAEQLSSAGTLIGDTPQLTVPLTRDSTTDDTPLTRVTYSENDDAYVMWTSGTTRSSPTRVTVPHASVLPNLNSLTEALQVDGSTKPLTTILVAPLTFDPSIIDLFLALGFGGTVVLPSPAIKLVPKLFVDTVHSHHVSTLQCTPSFIRRIPPALRATLFLAPSLRHVILGGEQFPPVSELRQWLVRHTSNAQLTVKHLYQGSANTANLQIFNIYGITEVSVWATLERVNVPRLLRKSEQYVPPLGPPMRDTHLAVRTDDNQFVLLAPYLQQRGLKRGTDANYNEESERHVTRDQVLSGQLLIGSQSRICRLNDETDPQEWRETGDLVRVVRGKIYYIGRVQDCLVKVNGKKINLLEISTTLKSCPQVREAMYVTNTALLVENVTNMDSVLAVDDFGLVCFVETNELDAVAAVNHFARQHLPSFMRPNHVLVMETVPITLNGKVDKTALRDIFRARVADQSSHTAVDRNAVSAFVLQHWRSAVSGFEDWSEDQIRAHHLVALGASSIDVFECADKLCARLGLNARMNGAEVKQQIHDALLHLNFSEVIDRVMTLINNKDEKQNSSTFDTSASTDASNALASTLLGTPLRATSRSGVVVTFDPVQHSRRAVLKDIPFKRAALKWKQWLIKCVDASPLVIETAQQKCVVIGSHSGHMTCLELYSGETIWRTYLPDRVESSATLVKVAQQFYICVGCYDHRVYFLNTVDGAVVWSYDLGGQIKSSAAQDPHSELVWIGAHSGTLVVLDVAQRECVMSQHFAAPIFAVPCIDTTRQRVYVAVEDRFLYAFNSAQFNVEWKLNLHAPLFSTPVVTSDGTVVVGGVNKIITAVSVAGVVLWQHSTGGPVFSSPALVTQLNGEYIVCGCHDGNLYCLDLRGELKWQRQLGNKPIFSSPFVGHTEQAAIIAACNTAGEIFVVSAAGELVTHVKCLGEVFSSPVLVESLLIVGSRDDSVYCFEFEE